MPRKQNPKPDNIEQSMKFLETAKGLESDKTGKLFQRALDVVVPMPSKRPKQRKA